MIIIKYDPKTKVYRITENGNLQAGKFKLQEVTQILQDYVLKMNGGKENDLQTR